MIKNSIKQLFRTPMRTLLYFLLIIFVGILFSLGLNLRAYNQNKIDVYEKYFTTIGTFEQEYNVLEKVEEWDAAVGDYRIKQEKTYGELLYEKDLLFDGASYIKEPEFRPIVYAYAPQYFGFAKGLVMVSTFDLVEFELLEEVIKGESTPVKITKMFTEHRDISYSDLEEGNNVFLCQHSNANPVDMEKGKTYVAVIGRSREQKVHGLKVNEYSVAYGMSTLHGEFHPLALASSQADIDGREISGPFALSEMNADASAIFEVTDNFYKTEIGMKYMDWLEAEQMSIPTISVIGTNSTKLLVSFHEDDAYITNGRDITTEEYREGEKVCLVSDAIAYANKLKPGDMIDLDLLTATFGETDWMNTFLNAQGQPYDIYEKNQYKIVGIYQDDSYTSFSLAELNVIIPRNSMHEMDYSNNIASYAPMRATDTSFQIENGKIDSFMEAFQKSGLEDKLNVVFYDMGYSQLEAGIKQMHILSLVFLVMGVVLMIFIIILFTNIYISNNIIITMIERTLGITKKECLLSLLSGVFLIIVAGSLVGGITGGIASQKLVTSSTLEDYYDRDFSRNIISLSDEELEGMDLLMNTNQIVVIYTAISIVILIVFGILMAFIKAINNIKQEPLKLLSARRE